MSKVKPTRIFITIVFSNNSASIFSICGCAILHTVARRSCWIKHCATDFRVIIRKAKSTTCKESLACSSSKVINWLRPRLTGLSRSCRLLTPKSWNQKCSIKTEGAYKTSWRDIAKIVRNNYEDVSRKCVSM